LTQDNDKLTFIPTQIKFLATPLLDRFRFVRRDQSSLVRKNTHIFLVLVGMVIWFSSAQSVQSAKDHALFY